MVHSGFEATAVSDSVKHPLKALTVALKGPRVDGPMAPEIPLNAQRASADVYDSLVANQTRRLEAEGRIKERNRAGQGG
jgi:hypothetical protein